MKKKILAFTLLISLFNYSQNLITEDFDALGDPIVLPTGWSSTNQSASIGTTSWFRGNPAVFNAHNGPTNGYIGANFNNTTGSNTISNWLISPVLNLQNGDVISFFTRRTESSFQDRLELRLSTLGSSSANPNGPTGVGDYTNLLISVNPTLVANGYPTVWTEFTHTITGLANPTDCRIAFRYFVTSGGPSGSNSDYIGIDAFKVDRTLSTEEFYSKNFVIYPNPVKDQLQIKSRHSEILSISIMDLQGRIMKQLTSNQFDLSWNISDLTSGIYLIEIQNSEGKGTSKFIKK